MEPSAHLNTQTRPIGRFAPSPTGELHLGSLTTALASYCHIKSLGGEWLLRIEDTDTERCDRQFTEQILIDLEMLGLEWDGDVIHQSERIDIYNEYLSAALAPLTYGCQCSRKSLARYWGSIENLSDSTPNKQRYPRCCIADSLDKQQHKLRLQLPDYAIGFMDGIQGMQWDNPQQTLGDMVVRRQDGMINYILAASIDDGLQGITHIMRGLDILPMTTAQISLLQMTGLPAVSHWYHLPLICHANGQKLSKQNLAQPIDTRDPSALLAAALKLLQQLPVALDTPERMLRQAISQWDNTPLRNKQQLAIF
ncbi:tRNA glutamyl-Q(34) synthetase GluQRS [Psychrobacter sp. 1U2]|uniref:tRNA glutamyl-Q(34) synthetase GluQRS n=1 Tax=Psychrobacter sp. 1U2 TaxID=3453577 RepID=UPI003F46D8E3